MARWYRALFPMPPPDVDRLRPTQVASILGLDLTEAVRAQPLTDEMLAALGNPEPTRSPERSEMQSKPRLRTVVGLDG